MKIGTITFHGAHNYGSMLQAYALQEYAKKLLGDYKIPCDYQIINYRSEVQKRIYQAPKTDSIKTLAKWLMYLPYKNQLDKQSQKFEAFITDHLRTTDEFSSAECLPQITSYFDVLIAGSDQIWNVRARDFDLAYLFPGCPNKKISVAASLGPLSIDWKNYQTEEYSNLLNRFSCISVRENKSLEMLREMLPENRIEVLPDPVFLLEVQAWKTIQSDMDPGKYILFYCLEPSREHIRIARLLSKKLNLPVVATKYRSKYDYVNPFIKQYDAGPCDFLSLIDHAAVVLTSSFHGTAFSLIYRKPFYVINGMEDGRIQDLLKLFGAEENDLPFGIQDIGKPSVVKNIESVIRGEQEKTRAYLTAALGLSIAFN